MTGQARPAGRHALTRRDDGVALDPQAPGEWDEWVSAGRTRNYCEEDPLLDWLGRFGDQHGFLRDDELEGYDPRTDFRTFLFERGTLFEERVVTLIRDRFGADVVRIAAGPDDIRSLAKAEASVEAMRSGVPVLYQAVLRNPQNRTYGAPDLLVRSDLLNELIPETLSEQEASIAAPGLGAGRWHYRVLDVKFHELKLASNGHASNSDELPYMAQMWVYNEALGRMQGYRPPASYLLGRRWKQGDERGEGCFERLARVDHDRALPDGRTLEERVAEAIAWIRRMRREGAGWLVLPEPSVPELYPHMRHDLDMPWHGAKVRIAEELAELTLLPAMNPRRRRAAHARGLKRWDDPAVSAATLGLVADPVGARYADQCDGVLLANRTPADEVVFPERIRRADPAWRTPAPLELYVDFETVSNLADDFTALPTMGGQPLIFQIGCGWREDGGLPIGSAWRFAQWTAERLTEAQEAAIIGRWIEHIEGLLRARKRGWTDARIVHWSPAEVVNLSSAYNSARQRHPENDWPPLPWFDILNEVIRAEPVTVRGAFNFGLKSIAKAMHAARLVQTDWEDGPTDGLGAMVGAWWCAGEAARLGVPMTALGLMAEIGRYNGVDCRAMAEIVAWLRANR